MGNNNNVFVQPIMRV